MGLSCGGGGAGMTLRGVGGGDFFLAAEFGADCTDV